MNSARLLSIFLLTVVSASARLGETETQLIERYGRVIIRSPEAAIEQGKIYPLADNLHFKTEGWNIIARLVNARCESITYSKTGDWTEEQFRHVLEANGGRGLWEERKTTSPKLHRRWVRRDGAVAEWRLGAGYTLETPAFPKAREALKRRAKQEASKIPKL